jgi:molecular chaperone GrpE
MKMGQKKPKQEKEKKTDKMQELTALLQRIQADFENYKKRVEKESKEFVKIAAKDFVVKLLPILDNFELALKNNENNDEFVKGIELIFSQLYSTLEQEGLKKIEAKGKKFDPYKHEALLQEEADEDGIVLEELQKGYELNGIVIRHTKVKISKRRNENAGAK